MSANSNGADEEQDDYMNMIFEDPTPVRETLTQKKKRLAREAETRGRPKSKAQLAVEEKEKREAALANNHIDPQSKGFKMMAALGYKAGTALGATRAGGPDERLLEPIGLATKEDRGGIGADAEKKRKIREAMAVKDDDLKRRKIEETDFRARQQQEREEKKQEGQVYAAMKVCERLEDEDGEEDMTAADTATEGKLKQPRNSNRPLHRINVLWRGLVKDRALRERDARMRHDVQSSSLRKPGYDDAEEEQDDRTALAKKDRVEEVAVDLDEEDEELDEFQDLPVPEKLHRLVVYLRQRWHYCFWCKHRYFDDAMEGCPGTTEEDHD
ncbi:hypothetical protein DV736_g1756, partial [Chaetothyriales sp. CBS 134916]